MVNTGSYFKCVLLSLIVHGLIMVIPLSFKNQPRPGEIKFYILDDQARTVRFERKTPEVKIGKRLSARIPQEEGRRQNIPDEPKEKTTEEKMEMPAHDIQPNMIGTTGHLLNIQEKAVDGPAARAFPEVRAGIGEKVFGESDGPSFIHREIPVYPYQARRMNKEGQVVLRLTIDERGSLKDVEVVERAGYGFTEAAIEAIRRSTFRPARSDDKPVASKAILTIKFRMER